MKSIIVLQMRQMLFRKEFAISLFIMSLFSFGLFFTYCYNSYGNDVSNLYAAYQYSVCNLVLPVLPSGFDPLIFKSLIIIYPIIAVLPFSDSFLVDKKNGIINILLTKTTRSKYHISKVISVFSSAFLVFFIPLLINFFLNLIAFPIDSWLDFTNTSSNQNVFLYFVELINFIRLFSTHPYIYYFVSILIFSSMCGLISVTAYAISFLTRNRLLVNSSFFFISLVTFYLNFLVQPSSGYGTDYSLSAYIFMFPNNGYYSLEYFLIIIAFMLMFPFFVIYKKGVSNRNIL